MRLPDWEQRLGDYLDAHRHAVFVWGELDCVLFAAGAIEAITGIDPAASVRGRYRTRIGSLRQLHARGYADLTAMMDAHFTQIVPARAMRGDIVMAQGSLGVCFVKNGYFVGQEGGESGLITLPLADWEAAWRIPFEAQPQG